MPESEVVRVMREFRAGLLREEGAQMREMARRWVQVERRLSRDIDEVLVEIERRQAAGEVFGRDQGPYVRLERYRALLAQTRGEIERYTAWVEGDVRGREGQLVRLAVEQSEAAIAAAGRANGVQVGFHRLPVEAVEDMAASLTADATAGSRPPLRELLGRAWPDATVRMTDALVNGVALGWNPRKTGRAMAEGLQQGALQRCLLIARTEQMRVYREATLANYRASGVVRGYKRLAAKSSRTCLPCLLEDGRFYELDEMFEEHPAGRCTLVPCLKGMADVVWQTGREWLVEQPEAVQRQVMGVARWDLWRAGQVTLEEMVERHEHPVWGGSLGVRPVSVLPGGAAALRRVYDATAARLSEAARQRAQERVKVAETERTLARAQKKRELQNTRLAEVQAMTLAEWQEISANFRRANKLPKLKMHYDRHGKEFVDLGVGDLQQLEALFLQHIRRADLEIFTYVSTEPGQQYRHWALIGMDNGVVALYNEKLKKHWTFMRPPGFQGYLRGGHDWWLKVDDIDGRPEVRRW